MYVPWWGILSQELNNVIEDKGKIRAPSSGPVGTKDVADCLAVLVTRCLEDAEHKGRLDKSQTGSSIQQMGRRSVKMPSPAIIQGGPFNG